MLRSIQRFSIAGAAVAAFTVCAWANTVSAGYISLDATNSGATFDIVNQTGANASSPGDPTFPIITPLQLNNILLTLDFAAGGSVTEDSSQFLSDGSGGYTGEFNLDLNQFPLSTAILTGLFSDPSVDLNDGTSTGIYQGFSATVDPSSGNTLQLGDFASIDATLTPEPPTYALLALAWVGLLGVARRRM